MKKIFVVFTILLGLLAGCAPATTPAPIPATKTLVSPTNTPIPATATFAPTASVAATQPLSDNGAGLIAFLSDRDGKPAIYVMNADGSDQRRLAGGKPRDTCLSPVWSPDGQRIAYMVVPNGLSGDRHGPLEIWSVGLDGAEPVELSVGVTDTLLAYPWNDPIWSPDGTRLAFAALHPVAGTSDKRSILTILRSDGSGVEQVFPLDWISGAVEWSPNGEQILIEDISPDESVRAHNVHVLSLSNGEIREVYRDIISAAWSPDGTEIVVVPAQSEQVLIVKLDGTSHPIGPLPSGITPELAVWSPDGIALAVFGTTNNREEAGLYLVTVSTGQVRSIALAAKYLHGLAYSPDGKQLLISTIQAGWSSHSSRWPKSTLWVYDLASDTLTALTDGKGYDAAGTWAPVPPAPSAPAVSVGGEIAFASDLDGDFEIWLVNADGSHLRQLTDNAAMDLSPAWSPDGSRLVFISNRDGNDELYTMNADGSDVRRLTETPDASESFPAWSPDGKFISFDSDRGGNWDVYIVKSDGSNPRRLTDHPGEDWISSWSPDGQKIAFESKRDGNYEIYVVNIDGSNPQRLTQNTVQDGAPKWSPDGSKIAFFSRRDGNPEIYVMNADGSNPLRQTNRAGDDSFPVWSPDGAWLVFSAGNNQKSEVYLISADGSQLQPLTANGAQNWSPAWRPVPTNTTAPIPATPTALPALLVDSGRRFQAQRTFSIALGDLDRDGDLDAVVTDFLTSGKVWLNDGTGVFTSGQKVGSETIHGVALGDLDGDGDLDAFVIHNKGIDQVWLNDGQGKLTDSGQQLGTPGDYGDSVTLGDVDGDGDLDAFTAHYQHLVGLWLNDGQGVFTTHVAGLGSNDTSATEVALGDVDGDGDLDALVSFSEKPNRVWFNDGQGNFADSGQNLDDKSSWGGSALGDVDGDGDLDAFIANSVDGNMIWFNAGGAQGGTPGIFANSGQVLGKGKTTALGDMDSDGDLDALSCEGLWLNNGSGVFSDSGLKFQSPNCSGISLGDVDGDGDLDIIFENAAFKSDQKDNELWLNKTH